MLLLLLFLIPAAIGLVMAFAMHPVRVVSNLVQLGAFLCTAVFGLLAYSQGFFDGVYTVYFLVTGGVWVVMLMARSPEPQPVY